MILSRFAVLSVSLTQKASLFQFDIEALSVNYTAAATSLACELKHALTRALPGSTLSWCSENSPKADPGYNFTRLGGCVDYFVVMEYTHGLGPGWEGEFSQGLSEYEAAGVPASQIVYALPFFGAESACCNSRTMPPCPGEQAHGGATCAHACWYRNQPCNGAIYPPRPFDYAGFAKIMETVALGHAVQYQPQLTPSPVIDITVNNIGPPTNMSMRFRWEFDDPRSVSAKATIMRAAKVGGVAMWTADALDYSNASRSGAMWRALLGHQPTSTMQGATQLPAGPTLSVVGRGASAADPTFGSSATIVVAHGQRGLNDSALPPWIRLDRPDGVAETGTGSDGDNSGRQWMTIADEMASFQSALVFPVWMRSSWGPFKLLFGGAANNRSVDIVASGWSDPGPNGTLLTKNSSLLTIHYSTACRQAKAVMEAVSLGPGKVRLSVSNLKADKLAKFCPVTQTAFFVYTPSATSPGMFDYVYTARAESDRNFSYVLQWAHPGIYYYGAAPSSRGRMMALTAGGEYNTVLGTHPMALVVATADGRVFNASGGSDGASLPPGFKGDVVHVTPLPQVSVLVIPATHLCSHSTSAWHRARTILRAISTVTVSVLR